MKFVVYCDESRHDAGPNNPYMAIGSLWIPRERKLDLTRRFRALCGDAGVRGEIKWSRASRKYLDSYSRLVDFFFDQEDIRYRVIVVDQKRVDIERYHAGDRELGFYKFYYELLVKWIDSGNEYLILLDYKRNKGADRYKTLRTVLERKLKGAAWITDLTVIDSRESPLVQLCDLLTGAVAASWSDSLREGGPKKELVDHVAKRCGTGSLRVGSISPSITKFNIFQIRL